MARSRNEQEVLLGIWMTRQIGKRFSSDSSSKEMKNQTPISFKPFI